ncbi:MAG: hypothetical protein SPL83_08165 [Succinivibrio sp.]|nr:hypothetical protein [Succinatimonas sp.]MDY6247197.1 hypothetical protein [Succinivibrio sp.]
MESPLNPYRAFILGEIYKAGNELDSVRAALKSALTSKQVNIFTTKSMILIDKIQTLNRILWALEVMIKADIVSKENSQEIINIFNELKEVQENIDLIYRLKSTRLVELVLELIERKKHISPDEIVGLI